MLSYRKVGGLRFVRIGRFGFSFYWSKPKVSTPSRVDDLLGDTFLMLGSPWA